MSSEDHRLTCGTLLERSWGGYCVEKKQSWIEGVQFGGVLLVWFGRS